MCSTKLTKLGMYPLFSLSSSSPRVTSLVSVGPSHPVSKACFSNNLVITVNISTTLSLPSATNVNSTSLRPLFDGGSVNLNQSFGCDVNRTFSNFVAITPDLHVSLFMMDLQVQAFDFTNATSGVFDSGKLANQLYVIISL